MFIFGQKFPRNTVSKTSFGVINLETAIVECWFETKTRFSVLWFETGNKYFEELSMPISAYKKPTIL